MIHAFVRRSSDVEYLTADRAEELDGLRSGGPGWWLRGGGDERSASDVGTILATTPRSTVTGYDLVVAAPRPLSILIAIDTDVAPEVVSAHRDGVSAAVDYLEERALVVRRRVAGDELVEGAQWSRVVSFTHGVNRDGEPHLHDHVLVGALPAGASTVADSRSLFAHLGAADSVYRATVRDVMNLRTERTAWRTFAGNELVSGVDEGFRAIWSGHIDERGPKNAWTRRAIVEHWRDDAARFEAVGTPRAPHYRAFDEHRFRGAFEGATHITRRDLVRAWADASPFGASGAEIGAAIDRLHPHLGLARGMAERPLRLVEARRVDRELERTRESSLVVGPGEGRYRERDSRVRSR